MRICIDARAAISITDGIGRYAQELVKAYADLDDDNEYIILKHPSLDVSFTFDKRFTEQVVQWRRFGLTEQVRLVPLLNEMRLDLFHSLHFTLPLFYKGPMVLTVHDVMPAVLPGFFGNTNLRARVTSAYINFIVAQSLKKSTSIIVDSNHTAKDIQKFFGRYKTHTVYLGIDHLVQIDTGIQDKISRDVPRPYFFVISNFRPYKNLPRLLEAFQLARKKLGDVELVIAGSNEKYKSRALERVPEESLQAVRFIGFVPDNDMPELFKNSIGFVFPSLYEGFGFPILEAMAAGAPVITSRSASLPELAGDAALYIDAQKTEGIADGLIQLALNPELQNKLREAGRLQSAKFMWSTTARQTLKVYDDAVRVCGAA